MATRHLDIDNTFVIGDNHFFHNNIIKYENRPFNSVDEMNESMIAQWNSEVSKKSKIIVCGDWIFGSKANIEAIVPRLNGYKILIIGNHDNYTPRYYNSIGVEEASNYPILVNDFLLFSHEPQYINEAMPYINVFAHVHSNPMYKDFSPKSACVSAERLGYRPIRLRKIIDEVNRLGDLK